MTSGRRGTSRRGAGGRLGVTSTSTRPARAMRIRSTDDVAVAVDALAAGRRIDGRWRSGRRARGRSRGPQDRAARARPTAKSCGSTAVPIGAHDGTDRRRRLDSLAQPPDRSSSGTLEYRYAPARAAATPDPRRLATFMGYRRADGTRRHAERDLGPQHRRLRQPRGRADREHGRTSGSPDAIDGVHAFAHPYGCSQLGDDLGNTQPVLAGLLRHPNAGGVLVLGLGCENNQLDALLRSRGRRSIASASAFFNTQDVIDEVEEGTRRVDELVERMARRRTRRRVRRRSSCSATSAAARTASAASRANPLRRPHRGSSDAARRQRAAHRGARDVRRRAAC